ncbi:MAG: hypothetical protein KC940_22545, partial [Candidatus Omnitrophica bacterium]|nr:hypothetical protein [Candidatus Omnitrophota bacterium]
RLTCVDCPEVIQDFGYSETEHTGRGSGEIGGRVQNSADPAYYALPIGKPLSFKDSFSASGKLTVNHIGLRGVAYIGFFNPEYHTWRVWSSMAFRIWEEDMVGQIMFDWMAGDWQARGAETAILLDPDGKVHNWSFKYEPDIQVDPVWKDKLLEKHITEETGNGRPYELQGEEFILERARKDDPALTAGTLHERLLSLRDQGLVEYFHRHGQHRWWKRPHPEDSHGRITLAVDDETPYVFWMDETVRNAPTEMTHFGLFNIHRYGEWMEVYLGDLTVNGERIELNQDPKWEGKNNRVQYTETSFQSMSDYGYCQTNWAGESPGEVGGLFWRTEPQDPNFSYYGADVGELTLDDPISFSGSIYFLNGMSDAAAYFGYFNSKDQIQSLSKGGDKTMENRMGLQFADASSIGYRLRPTLNTSQGDRAENAGPIFTPNKERHRFTFEYDPKANNGVGAAVMTLDGESYPFDLTPRQREEGAVFDRFGFANVRGGGNSVEVYFDDVGYTAREGKLKKFEQEVIPAPYPKESGGRKY